MRCDESVQLNLDEDVLKKIIINERELTWREKLAKFTQIFKEKIPTFVQLIIKTRNDALFFPPNQFHEILILDG